MIINTNTTAMSAARLLDQSTQGLRRSLARLSSGAKIVSPEDDAAGLAQSMKLNNETIRNDAASKLLENGISFLQTKDGFLQKVQKALDRMSELSTLTLDVTKTNTDRSNYNTEFQTLKDFITDIGGKDFNGKSLFYSTYTKVTSANITWTAAHAAAQAAGGHLATITSPGELNAVLGAVGSGQNLWIGLTDSETEGQFKWVTGEPALYTNWLSGQPDNSGGTQDYAKWSDLVAGQWDDDNNSGSNLAGYILETGPELVINGEGDTIHLPTDGIPYLSDNLGSESAARTALTNVKSAIDGVARARANVGALIARVQSENESLRIKNENLTAAVSRIQDTNVAVESATMARQSILTQSGTAMLAQANLLPQAVLRLLG